MKLNDNQLADALFSSAVADQETIRARVLHQAHQELPQSGGAPSHRRPVRRMLAAAAPMAACLAFFVLVNVSAPFARAVAEVPVLGSLARIVTLRQWDSESESAAIHGEQPAIVGTGSEDFETAANALIAQRLSDLEAQAEASAEDYRANWIAMGNDPAQFVPIRYAFDYETFYTSETALSFLIRERETITTDTEDTYTTLFYYNLDIAAGEDLTLERLLGTDWKAAAAQAVDEQIRQSGDQRRISFYQEFWVDKNVSLDDTQKFYLTGDGQVALVFDEGWIAPFEDGPQTFVLPQAPPLGVRGGTAVAA